MLEHRLLYDESAIATRVDELARCIRADLPGTTPLVVGLLTGSYVFMADLLRAGAKLGIEPRVDFMALSHYGSGHEASGRVKILKDTALSVRDQCVLLVDDILDSGVTLKVAREHLLRHAPAWLRTCVFLDKPTKRTVEIQADYVGFHVPDVWLIGYGLDLAGEGRALPYIAAVDPGAGNPTPTADN